MRERDADVVILLVFALTGGVFGVRLARRHGYVRAWQQVAGFAAGMVCWAFGVVVLLVVVALDTFALRPRTRGRSYGSAS